MSRESGAEPGALDKKSGSYVGVGASLICPCIIHRCKFFTPDERRDWLVCALKEGQQCPLTAEGDTAKDLQEER